MLVLYDVPDHLVDYHLSTIIIIRLIGFITGKRGQLQGKKGHQDGCGKEMLDEGHLSLIMELSLFH